MDLPLGPISFRLLREEDLSLLCSWHRQEHVAAWWREDALRSDRQLREKYEPRIRGESHVLPFLALLSGKPFAYIQCCAVEGDPQYAQYLQLNRAAIGIDFFIGEAEHIGRGLGANLLRSFLLLEGFPRFPEADYCVVDPAAANQRSIRACEKAGFVYDKDLSIPDAEEPQVLLGIERSVLFDEEGKPRGSYPPGYSIIEKELWTARQRQMSRLHEISYRACFKAELPDWFIERYTEPGDIVYDPFAGRGTTALQASLRGRRFISNDLNPLSRILTEPRITPPPFSAILKRLEELDLDDPIGEATEEGEPDLEPFYNQQTLKELRNLRRYLQQRRVRGAEDLIDAWIRMVATNRLTGHSRGFFSVYTLPPNQAVSPERQRLINARYGSRMDEYRNIKELIARKSRTLLKDCMMGWIGTGGLFLSSDAAATYAIPERSVQLVVTSPPFLNVVQYERDNWLRLWFNCLDGETISKQLIQPRNLQDWEKAMARVFRELKRVMAPGAYGAFEVGEVRHGTVKLDEAVYRLLMEVDLLPEATLINRQEFTKTANIWGISNNRQGTNSNRIVLFRQGV